jgi:hypothetical protein
MITKHSCAAAVFHNLFTIPKEPVNRKISAADYGSSADRFPLAGGRAQATG